MERITQAQSRQTAENYNRKRLLPAELSGGFEFRACTMEDLEALLEAGAKSFAYNSPTRPEMRHALTKAHAAIFALDDVKNERLAGYLFVEGHMARKNLYINTAALLEEYRGKGLGSALYEFAAIFAADLGAKGLWCHTAFDNSVNIHLMKKLGYGILRREESYYDDGKACLVFAKDVAA